MASVYIERRKPKNPKGRTSYRVKYKDPVTFQSKYYKTFHKFKEAQQAKTHLEGLIDNNRMVQVKKHRRKVQPVRFNEVGEKLVQDWAKKLRRKELSQATYNDYSGRIDFLNREFGGKLVAEFSKSTVEGYHQRLFEESSPASANRYLFILKQIFRRALLEGAVVEDPAADIRYFSEKQHQRNTFLDPAGINALVDASQKTRAKHYMPALVYLGAEHGASKQEALSLEWTDIKFDAEGDGTITFFRTKNKRERTEFLMPRAKEALLAWKAHLEFVRHRRRIKVVDDRFVFCRQDGSPIKRFDSAWRNTCKLAGIEDFHFHDLRHTFCSNLIMSGADLKETKDMIGHKDIAMTDRYTHLSALHKKTLQDRLSERYSMV